VWGRLLSGTIAPHSRRRLTHFEDRIIVDLITPRWQNIVAVRRLETNDIVVLQGLRGN
jgi:hypothetical protein